MSQDESLTPKDPINGDKGSESKQVKQDSINLKEQLTKSEIEKNIAEKNKFIAEKNRTDLESKEKKNMFWVKPAIAGIAIAISFLLFGYDVVKKLIEVYNLENEKQNLLTERRLREDSILIAKSKDLVDQFANQVSAIKEDLNRQADSVRNLNSLIASLKMQPCDTAVLKKYGKLFGSITKSKSKVILWVDDNPANNAYIAGYLKSKGYDTLLAKTTSEAIKIIANNNPPIDLVISDLDRNEYGKDIANAGQVLFEQLKEKNLLKPLIIYSSSAMQQNNSTIRRELESNHVLVTNDFNNILNFLESKQ